MTSITQFGYIGSHNFVNRYQQAWVGVGIPGLVACSIQYADNRYDDFAHKAAQRHDDFPQFSSLSEK